MFNQPNWGDQLRISAPKQWGAPTHADIFERHVDFQLTSLQVVLILKNRISFNMRIMTFGHDLIQQFGNTHIKQGYV